MQNIIRHTLVILLITNALNCMALNSIRPLGKGLTFNGEKYQRYAVFCYNARTERRMSSWNHGRRWCEEGNALNCAKSAGTMVKKICKGPVRDDRAIAATYPNK